MSPSTLTVDGTRVPARYAPLWWHLRGLSQTASGYGRWIATPHLVQYGGRWRRVYCAIYSNVGTCYIDGPVDTATGRRSWLVVTD